MADEKLRINDKVFFIDGRFLNRRPVVNEGLVINIDEEQDNLEIRDFNDETQNIDFSNLGKTIFTSKEEAEEAIKHFPSAGRWMYLIRKDHSIKRIAVEYYWLQTIHFTSRERIPISKISELLYPSEEAAIEALQVMLAKRSDENE
jgi:hypothetical protein